MQLSWTGWISEGNTSTPFLPSLQAAIAWLIKVYQGSSMPRLPQMTFSFNMARKTKFQTTMSTCKVSNLSSNSPYDFHIVSCELSEHLRWQSVESVLSKVPAMP